MHDHDLVCGSCGNELRSVTQDRCTHCGANDPLHAAADDGNKQTVGSPEFPRTIGGLTLEQVREALAGHHHLQPSAASSQAKEKRYSNFERSSDQSSEPRYSNVPTQQVRAEAPRRDRVLERRFSNV